jgi:hypothetical protein
LIKSGLEGFIGKIKANIKIIFAEWKILSRAFWLLNHRVMTPPLLLFATG